MSVVSPKVLGRVLADRGFTMEPEEFLSVLADAVDSTDTLTDSEQDLLIKHGGAASDAFTPARQASARQQIAISIAQADAEASHGYSTREVAQMLATATANVRRAVARGDLFVAGHTRNREHVFPTWQFRGGRVLPHLREVVAALPSDMHPLDVQTFMTTPRESLGDRSPADWLAHGGNAESVVRLAGDLGRL